MKYRYICGYKFEILSYSITHFNDIVMKGKIYRIVLLLWTVLLGFTVSAAETNDGLLAKQSSHSSVRLLPGGHSNGLSMPIAKPAQRSGRTLATAGASPIRKASAAGVQHPTIYAGVISTNAGENWTDYGIYKVPTSDSGVFERVVESSEGANFGGGVGDGKTYTSVRYFTYYGMDFIQAYFYDIATWKEEETFKNIDLDLVANDLSYDPVSGQIYGCFYSKDAKDTWYFGTADYRNGTRKTIAKVDRWNVLAIDKNGNAFAIDYNGNLLSVDKATGATTVIASTGLKPYYPTTGTIDPRSGLLYWNLCPEDGHSYLYTVDTKTGKATYVTKFANDEQLTGMYIPLPEAEELAPAAVSNLSLDFPQGALSGNVAFTAPTTTFNGEPAEGELSYTVVCSNGEEKTGKTTYGAACNVPFTFAALGEYSFSVSVSNSVGRSPVSKVAGYLGKGVPAGTTATVSYSDGVATISWKPVSTSADGGYVDPSSVTYKVVRYPDEYVVAEAATGTEVSIPLPEPEQLTSYYFTVTAQYDGKSSAAATTNTLVLGAIVPPYSEGFDTETSIANFTVLDVDGDKKTWEYATDGTVRSFYPSEGTADNWLITAPMKLEAGKMYRISFDVRNSYGADYVEYMEVKAGTANTADAMTIPLFGKFEITDKNWRTKEVTFTPTTSGRYFIGFRAMSTTDGFWIGLDNISVGAGISQSAPDVVTDLKALANSNGGNSVEISFVTPSRAINGSEISSLSKVEIFRDSEEAPIKTFENPTVGTKLSFTDTGVATGSHTYSVIAYSSEGQGNTAVAGTFVGINVPSAVTGLKIAEGPQPGYATAMWTAPATDKDGNPINPAFVTYTISNVDGEIVKEGVKETTYTSQFAASGEQQFALFGVTAVTSAGSSEPVFTPLIPVGKAYAAPYRDSFNENFGGIWGITSLEGNPKWSVIGDTSLEGVTSQDHDDSMLAMQGSRLGEKGAAYTGKISLEGCKKPSATFYVYNFTSDQGADSNTLEVQAREADGVSEYTTLKTVTNSQLGDAPGWYRISVPLDAFSGKTVQLRFVPTVLSYELYAIDNMFVGDLPDKNLSVTAVSAPFTVKANTDFTISATVANNGADDAGEFTAELSLDGTVVESRKVSGLKAGLSIEVEFTSNLPITRNDAAIYTLSVVYEGDEDATDNKAQTSGTKIQLSDYPTVNGLSGKRTSAGVQLEWSAVDLTKVESEPVTDSFEDYTAFSTKPAGDWKFVDKDGGYTFVPEDIVGDGVAYDTPLSFFVMDATHPNLNSSFAAHDGNKYLGAFYNTDATPNNDWAISPRLSGKKQTISFYAKSYNVDYGQEKFEIRYSTGGNNPEDFTETVATHTLSTNDWTLITADVPEGATYAAIHYVSENQYMFFVDSFTYDPAPWADRLTLAGYNVYRDGKPVTNAPVAQPSFTDTNADSSIHKYCVTAVYDKGESAPSAEIIVDVTSGVDGIANSEPVVGVEDHTIIVSRVYGEDVAVYTASGVAVARCRQADDVVRVAVPAGVYLVKTGKSVHKVVVR